MLIANAQNTKTKYEPHRKRWRKCEDYGNNCEAQAAFSPNCCSTWLLHCTNEQEKGIGAMPTTPVEPLK